MTNLTPEGRAFVTVRLSSIDSHLRLAVATEIIRRGKLPGREAAAFKLAAAFPIDDPPLRVPAEKADVVLRERRLPPGQMPPVWKW